MNQNHLLIHIDPNLAVRLLKFQPVLWSLYSGTNFEAFSRSQAADLLNRIRNARFRKIENLSAFQLQKRLRRHVSQKLLRVKNTLRSPEQMIARNSARTSEQHFCRSRLVFEPEFGVDLVVFLSHQAILYVVAELLARS